MTGIRCDERLEKTEQNWGCYREIHREELWGGCLCFLQLIVQHKERVMGGLKRVRKQNCTKRTNALNAFFCFMAGGNSAEVHYCLLKNKKTQIETNDLRGTVLFWQYYHKSLAALGKAIRVAFEDVVSANCFDRSSLSEARNCRLLLDALCLQGNPCLKSLDSFVTDTEVRLSEFSSLHEHGWTKVVQS